MLTKIEKLQEVAKFFRANTDCYSEHDMQMKLVYLYEAIIFNETIELKIPKNGVEKLGFKCHIEFLKLWEKGRFNLDNEYKRYVRIIDNE